ncbi:PREDICTED: U-box domain-containing protein 52-like isoform X2 [Lupinus angustifolius]|uniref:U-box domain-containing protein 52-like isoform X2 n=1 Tax=Lupinus angustifolius TaxID=3871 RepID=UPI00092FB712|nr:PREDICTED: U-box domain-containing protein 52-like isoform X2 [Lupinus angustifolius]
MSFRGDESIMLPVNITMVAVDSDKNSGYAFHWATHHIENSIIIAVHVKHKNIPHQGTNVCRPDEDDEANVFSQIRPLCNPNIVKLKEAVVDDSDITRGILEFAQRNHIHCIVVGAPSTKNKNSLTSVGKLTARSFTLRTGTKKHKEHQNPQKVAEAIIKEAPDYISVYVISKRKLVAVRPATSPLVNVVAPPVQPLQPNDYESENGVRCQELNNLIAYFPIIIYNSNMTQTPRVRSTRERTERKHARERPRISTSTQSMGSFDLTINREQRLSSSSDENNSSGSLKYGSTDVIKHDMDLSIASDSQSSGDVEVEMKKLRLKLKQTMDMYSSACKDAISAQNKAEEINLWKMERRQRFKDVRLSEETALAMAEKEKAKVKAALEAAEKAMKMAEKEARRRLQAEKMAKRDAKEKDWALTALASKEFRCREYTIEDIEKATEKFSPSLKIGEGGYGPVFKGQLDHTSVAIKLLNPEASQGRKQFQQEVEVLSTIRHPNMVLLLGACPEYGCLVYEYMNKGSLEDRLLMKNNSPPIPWPKRFEIASEIATALLFLHQTKPEPLVHRDLKPANILLDRNFVSKISDVGLARLVPPSVADSVTQYYMTAAAGTFCYIDPEYQQTGKLTTKSDIYSFGIVLLQIITAKPPMGIAHHVKRAIDNGSFSDMLDPVVTDWPVEEALAFAKLALKCAELSKKDRPNLALVVVPELNRLRDFGYTSQNNQIKNRSHSPRPPTPRRNSHSIT